MAADPYDDPLDLPDDSTVEPAHHSYPIHTKKRIGKKILISAFVLILVAGLAFGAAALSTRKSNTQAVKVTPPAASISTASPSKDLADTTGTKTYDNGPLGLGFTYPSNWIITETADNGVRVESPVFTYQNLLGESTSGNFRIYIRKGARVTDAKYIGRAVAIEPSEKLTYTKPAVGQRSDTLLSNFGLDNTNNFAFFMIAGNFKLNIGDTLGPTYGKEPETFIVSGGFSSKELKDDMQTSQVPSDYIKTSNAYKQAIKIIKSLQLT
jgi:hypothetical protein